MLAGISGRFRIVVRVVDPRVFEREDGRPVGRRADGDQDHVAPELDSAAADAAVTATVWGSTKEAAPVEELDVVPVQVADDPGPLVGGDVAARGP